MEGETRIIADVFAIELQKEIYKLQAAIRKHRDCRSDDRCWLDDEELYKALPEGYTPPAREVAVELEYCKKFIECRQNPQTEYISPQRRIEELESLLEERNQEIINLKIRPLKERYCPKCAKVNSDGFIGTCEECQNKINDEILLIKAQLMMPSNSKLLELANDNPTAQEWYDEESPFIEPLQDK